MKYHKKSDAVDAIQLRWDTMKSLDKFIPNPCHGKYVWVSNKTSDYKDIQINKGVLDRPVGYNRLGLIIHTSDGDRLVVENDYVIRGVNGEYYPCKPDIFEKTYDGERETKRICKNCEWLYFKNICSHDCFPDDKACKDYRFFLSYVYDEETGRVRRWSPWSDSHISHRKEFVKRYRLLIEYLIGEYREIPYKCSSDEDREKLLIISKIEKAADCYQEAVLSLEYKTKKAREAGELKKLYSRLGIPEPKQFNGKKRGAK